MLSIGCQHIHGLKREDYCQEGLEGYENFIAISVSWQSVVIGTSRAGLQHLFCMWFLLRKSLPLKVENPCSAECSVLYIYSIYSKIHQFLSSIIYFSLSAAQFLIEATAQVSIYRQNMLIAGIIAACVVFFIVAPWVAVTTGLGGASRA